MEAPVKAPPHRLILNETYGEVVEGVMEAQSHLESARRINGHPEVDAHLGEALDELRASQRILSGARFVQAWDGSVERRREAKSRNGAYEKRSEARA